MRFCAGTKRLQNGASFFSETAYFFPLSFPLTAFSEFYGILRASLESLENTTLFRRAFTPFYTPSLIQDVYKRQERRSSGVFERSERKRLALVLAGSADNAGGAGVDQESMG